MWVRKTPPRALPLQLLLWGGFLTASAMTCDRDRATTRAGKATTPPPVTITFGPNQEDVAPDAVLALDPIARRAWSDLALRVLVVGFANEHGSLRDNLDLADRRARIVADHLLSLGMSRDQIIVSAREAAVGDRLGSRCEVEIVTPLLLQHVSSRIHLGSTGTRSQPHPPRGAFRFTSATRPEVAAASGASRAPSS